MRYAWAFLLAVLAAACAKSPTGALKEVPAARFALTAQAEAATRTDRTLAYEHHVGIELKETVLPQRLDAVRKACVEDPKHTCTLLDVSREETRGTTSGTVRMRVPPAGVEPISGAKRRHRPRPQSGPMLTEK